MFIKIGLFYFGLSFVFVSICFDTDGIFGSGPSSGRALLQAKKRK